MILQGMALSENDEIAAVITEYDEVDGLVHRMYTGAEVSEMINDDESNLSEKEEEFLEQICDEIIEAEDDGSLYDSEPIECAEDYKFPNGDVLGDMSEEDLGLNDDGDEEFGATYDPDEINYNPDEDKLDLDDLGLE